MRSGPARGVFVTGTDTGVGKTTIARGLLRLAHQRGLHPVPFKPVETGCDPLPADASALWEAAGHPLDRDSICLHALRLPAAPALAAQAEGRRLDLEPMVSRARELAAAGDFLLVEGAGGLLVPYSKDATAADLAIRLALPILVVARTALGTINHTALTIREALRSNLRIWAVILNQTEPTPGPQEYGNADLIAGITGICPLGPVPYLPALARTDPDRIAEALQNALGREGIDTLFAALFADGPG